MSVKARKLFDPPIVKRAIVDSFLKLNPRHQVRNPVMFVVFVGSIADDGADLRRRDRASRTAFIVAVAVWLWFTVLFANFAEAMAEGRGKAQADTLRGVAANHAGQEADASRSTAQRPNASRRRHCAKAIVVLVEAGDFIPVDGEVDRRRRVRG